MFKTISLQRRQLLGGHGKIIWVFHRKKTWILCHRHLIVEEQGRHERKMSPPFTFLHSWQSTCCSGWMPLWWHYSYATVRDSEPRNRPIKSIPTSGSYRCGFIPGRSVSLITVPFQTCFLPCKWSWCTLPQVPTRSKKEPWNMPTTGT